MADPVDFAATIASLQEQIDTLNGELAGHRNRVTAEVEATGLDDSKHGGAISDVKIEEIYAKGEGIGGGTVVIPSEA